MSQSRRVLVVEDHEGWRQNYEEVLEDYDFGVTTCASKIAAFEAIDENEFDLAILDINLTDEPFNRDGIEVANYLSTTHPKTRIIVISGSVNEDVAEHLASKGIPFIGRGQVKDLDDDLIPVLQGMLDDK